VCGIAGILRLTPPGEAGCAAFERTPFDAIPESWLDLLDGSIRHRGPDGQGRFRDRAVRADGTVADVALVHRRLSIIDRGGGAQPMVSQRAHGGGPGTERRKSVEGSSHAFRPLVFHGEPNDAVRYEALVDHSDTLAVVFNGCIYNHRELRRQLEAAGRRFATGHSDTEVLLHGGREWGSKLSDHLEGMFAFGVWNRQEGSLHLSGDWVGEKPLYCAGTLPLNASIEGLSLYFAFASTLPGLFQLTRVWQTQPAAVNREDLREWIGLGYEKDPPMGPQRLIGDAFVPGKSSAATSQRHARVPVHPVETRRTREYSVEEVDRACKEAVETRLESDVPLGCFLSGGVDSSLIAHYAKHALGALQTFTVRMPDRRYDESSFASDVSAFLGTEHTTLDVDPRPAEDVLRLITQLGLPFGDSSLLPTYWVARASRDRVAVALTGDGGDELFAGYERHAINWPRLRSGGRFAAVIPRWLLSSAHPRSRRGRLARAADAASWETSDIGRIFSRRDLAELIASRSGEAFRVDDRPDYTGAVPTIERDFWYYLPGDLLRKTDTATMSVALEARAPLLATPVVKMGLTSKLSSLLPGGQRKGLLRAVARRHLPAHIVDRPKMGFAIPIGEWFRSDYGELRTLLLDHMNSTEPFGPPSLGIDLNMAYVRQMLDEHLGTGPSGLVKRDHSQRLYMLLVLSIWAKWLGSLSAHP
jgi:asparagine synthase (glutamine-hydrolysing)